MQQPSQDNAASIRYRTLFISDVHLGTKACQAEELLEFLKRYDADTYYLVGDIVDFWRIKRSPHWPQSHNDVVQKLLRKVRKGARFVYIPGNHDEFLRDYIVTHFVGIELQRETLSAVQFDDPAAHFAGDGRLPGRGACSKCLIRSRISLLPRMQSNCPN